MVWPKVRVSKIAATRRQLDCAIQLWFGDRDAVSIHTLAAAGHKIVHDLNEKKGIPGSLILNAVMVKPEYHKYVADMLKKPENFFKHADNDPDGILEFAPELSSLLITVSLMGLQHLGEHFSDEMTAFMRWRLIHDPGLFEAETLEAFAKAVPVEAIEDFRTLPKHEFFRLMLQAAALARAKAFI